MPILDKNEDLRIKTISDNLLSLFGKRKGVIFSCGALHATNLLKALKERNLDKNVLYYFSHSEKNYDDSINDVKAYLDCKTLEGHKFCIKSDTVIKSLSDKVIKEIRSKNTFYKEEINGGSPQSKLLNEIFKVDFKAFMRPGYYVDGLLRINDLHYISEIIKKLDLNGILNYKSSFFEEEFLVIPEINIKVVAEKIYSLQFKTT